MTRLRHAPFIDAHTALSERQGGILLDLLHDEEGSRLSDARKGDQLLPMQRIEPLHVTRADLQQVVEVTRHQTAVQYVLHLKHRAFERREALRVDLSRTTPTITRVLRPTFAGANSARTPVMNPSSNRRCVRLW